jgi:hypothetical protein
MMFLKTVAHFDFHYFTVVIDKYSRQFIRTGLTDKNSLYEYACGHIFSMIDIRYNPLYIGNPRPIPCGKAAMTPPFRFEGNSVLL